MQQRRPFPGNEKVGQTDRPDRIRAKKRRRQPRGDEALRSEDASVGKAQLQESGAGDPTPLAARQVPSMAQRNRDQRQGGEGHSHAAKQKGGKIFEADLDHQPSRSPDGATQHVKQERTAAHPRTLRDQASISVSQSRELVHPLRLESDVKSEMDAVSVLDQVVPTLDAHQSLVADRGLGAVAL